MATKFYLHNAAAPYTPATIRGAWDQTAGAVTNALDTQREGGGANTFVQIAETSATNPFRVLLGRWISGPLGAQTLSGTVDVVLGIIESAAAADINWYLHLYVTQGNSDTPRGTILADFSEAVGVNEWPTAVTFKGLNAAATLSALAISAGDRLVVEIGYVSREASATSRNGLLRYGTLNATSLAVQADGVAAGTDVTLKSGFITFSGTITEDTVAVRLSQDVVEVLTAAPATAPVRLSQMVLEVLSRRIPVGSDPGGGGSGGNGIDPTADVTLCGIDIPVVWIEVQTDSGVKVYAYDGTAIDSTFKEARLLAISPIRRAVSDRTGLFETASMTVTLADTDRAIRGLAATGTLLNKRVDVYCASAAQIRAGSVPRRLAMMVIRDFTPQSNLTFSLQLEDYLGSILGEFGTPKPQPARTFTFTDFPFLPAALYGKAVPIGYGLLSDESTGASAIGVVPAIFVGARRLGDGTDWDEYVLCGHAIKSITSWFASDLSDVAVIDPASGGHGPRPVKMPSDTEGVDFLIPGYAHYTAIVGAATYRDFNSRRYTVIYVKGQRSTDAKNGDCPISLNIGGIEDVGDGSGTMIDSLPRQIEHFINNYVLGAYTNGNWPTAPVVNGYTRVDHTSFEAVKTISALRVGGAGYLGAWLLGWDGSQQATRDVLQQLCQDCDANLAINRHGRIVLSMVYALTASVKTFTDVTDIADGSFKVKRRFELLANRITFRFRKNFILDSRPDSARTGFEWWSDQSGTSIDTTDGSSVTAINETRLLALEGWSLRDTATAADVPSKLLGRLALGPDYATFQTDLCGADVDLGDNIKVTDFEGMSATGWTTKLLRVERLTVYPDTCLVEIEGQAI